MAWGVFDWGEGSIPIWKMEPAPPTFANAMGIQQQQSSPFQQALTAPDQPSTWGDKLSLFGAMLRDVGSAYDGRPTGYISQVQKQQMANSAQRQQLLEEARRKRALEASSRIGMIGDGSAATAPYQPGDGPSGFGDIPPGYVDDEEAQYRDSLLSAAGEDVAGLGPDIFRPPSADAYAPVRFTPERTTIDQRAASLGQGREQGLAQATEYQSMADQIMQQGEQQAQYLMRQGFFEDASRVRKASMERAKYYADQAQSLRSFHKPPMSISQSVNTAAANRPPAEQLNMTGWESLNKTYSAAMGASGEIENNARMLQDLTLTTDQGRLAGMRQVIREWTGLEPEALENQQMLTAAAGDFVMGRIAETKGAVSEKEMEYFQRLSPEIRKRPVTNYAIAEIAKRAAVRTRMMPAALREFAATGLPPEQFKAWFFRNKDPFGVFDIDAIRAEYESRKGGSPDPTAPSTPMDDDLRSKGYIR